MKDSFHNRIVLLFFVTMFCIQTKIIATLPLKALSKSSNFFGSVQFSSSYSVKYFSKEQSGTAQQILVRAFN